MNNLQKLINICKCGVDIDVNVHRNFYATAEEYIENAHRNSDLPEELEDAVRDEMIRTNTIIICQCYPDTPKQDLIVQVIGEVVE